MNISVSLTASLALTMALCCPRAFATDRQSAETRLSEVGVGYSATSVNAAVFRNNSIVSLGDDQYIAFYDSLGYVTLGKRRLGSDSWTIRRSQYKGDVADAHNVISLMVDGDGYLHLSFNHHNVPLNYCRSVAPGSLEMGPLEPMTGKEESRVTYPEFYRLANGDLLFVCRSGESGRGNLVMNRYDVKRRKWRRLHDVLIDGENARSAYWQLCTDKNGRIHLSWVWRETWGVETNHDLCYACSYDGGETWVKSTGERYTLPITAANAEYACHIPQKSELINQTGMAADAEGHPYIATYWREKGDSVPQYRMVWNDGKGWHSRQLSQRVTPFSLSGGGTKSIPVARPRILVDKNRAYVLFRDVERGSRVSMYTADIQSDSVGVCDLTSFAVDAWEPTFDTCLWTDRHQLDIFVQRVGQGDGERLSDLKPQPVYVLETTLP